MKEEIRVGQTWLTSAGNLIRVVSFDGTKIIIKRIGIVSEDGQEHPIKKPESYCWVPDGLRSAARIVSRNARKYDEYLASL